MAARNAGQSVTEYIMEAVRCRIEQEAPGTGTPGVVKNPEGGLNSAE